MDDLVVGYSGKTFAIDRFDLTNGVTIRSIYAHLMAPFMVAFKPAPLGQHHPGPWKAAEGGLGFDIQAELFIPSSVKDTLGHGTSIVAWIITALLRLRTGCRLRVPVVSDTTFTEASKEKTKSQFWPVEIERQSLILDELTDAIDNESLEWIKGHWIETLKLFVDNAEFRILFNAFDETQFSRTKELALIQLWSALEGLFSPARTELRYRVSTNIASYLLNPGSDRMQLQMRVVKLYDARSAVAHGSDIEAELPLKETYFLTKEILEKIIHDRRVPTDDEIRARVFGAFFGPSGA